MGSWTKHVSLVSFEQFFQFFLKPFKIYSKVHFLLRIFPAAALAAILPGAPITPPPGWAPAQNNNHEEKKDEMVIAMVFSPDHDHDHDHEEKKDVMVFSPDPQSRRPGMGVCGLGNGLPQYALPSSASSSTPLHLANVGVGLAK